MSVSVETRCCGGGGGSDGGGGFAFSADILASSLQRREPFPDALGLLSQSDAVGHFVVAVVRHAVAAVSLDLQDAGVGARRRRAGIRVPPWAPVPAGALAERRGVHLLELRIASLAHGEQAAGLLVLASYLLQSGTTN